MASSLTIKVATFTSAITFNKSDSDVGNILRWFVAGKMEPIPDGLTPQQQSQYILDQAAQEIVRYVRTQAAQARLAELQAQIQSIEAQAAQDTEI